MGEGGSKDGKLGGHIAPRFARDKFFIFADNRLIRLPNPIKIQSTLPPGLPRGRSMSDDGVPDFGDDLLVMDDEADLMAPLTSAPDGIPVSSVGGGDFGGGDDGVAPGGRTKHPVVVIFHVLFKASRGGGMFS